MKNEDIVRLEPSGEVSYERVRTFAGPRSTLHEPSSPLQGQSAAPNIIPETPVSPENGTLFAPETASPDLAPAAVDAAQVVAAPPLAGGDPAGQPAELPAPEGRIYFHEAASAGNEFAPAPASGVGEHSDKVDHREADASRSPMSRSPMSRSLATGDSEAADPLEELLARRRRARAAAVPRCSTSGTRGSSSRCSSLGMSLRQAAAVLGVAHTTIRTTLAKDPALAEEITAARFQAQLQPLACVIREARRSWKAATWLLKYLDAKIATHEETPDERRARQGREREEFFAQAMPGVRKK